jgi:hypothetical protein
VKTKDEFFVLDENESWYGPHKIMQLAIDKAKEYARSDELDAGEEKAYTITKRIAVVKARGKGGNKVWVEE